MGSIVLANCPCGFSQEMFLGGGEMNYRDLAAFPALCPACQAMRVANLMEKEPRCPDCGSRDIVPYDDPSLAGERGSKQVFRWNVKKEIGRILALRNGTYRCARCGEPSLRFSDVGVWD